jgi:predicted AAA+ superfamily ATPase
VLKGPFRIARGGTVSGGDPVIGLQTAFGGGKTQWLHVASTAC